MIRSWVVIPLLAVSVYAADSSGVLRGLLSTNPTLQQQSLAAIPTLSNDDKQIVLKSLTQELRGTPQRAEIAAYGIARLDTLARFAAPDLVEALRFDADSVTTAVNEALLKAGPAAVDPLRKALGDANFILRRRAAVALSHLGPDAKRAAPELVDVLDDPQLDVRAAAEDALRKIGKPAIKALKNALADKSSTKRQIVSDVLARLDTSAAPLLREQLKDKDPEMRLAAADNLARYQPTEEATVQALMDSAAKDFEEQVRLGCIRSLAALNAKAAIGPLLSIGIHDTSSLVRTRAMEASIGLGEPTAESVDGLFRALHDPDAQVRLKASALIGRLNQKTPLSAAQRQSFLSQELQDSEPSLRQDAVQRIAAWLTPEASIPFYRKALADSAGTIRRQAMTGLAGLKRTELLPDFIAGLSDRDDSIRFIAVEGLAALGPAGIPGLVQAMSEPVLQGQAAAQILRQGDAAKPALEQLTQSTDPTTRDDAKLLLQKLSRPHKSTAKQKPAKRKR